MLTACSRIVKMKLSLQTRRPLMKNTDITMKFREINLTVDKESKKTKKMCSVKSRNRKLFGN